SQAAAVGLGQAVTARVGEGGYCEHGAPAEKRPAASGHPSPRGLHLQETTTVGTGLTGAAVAVRPPGRGPLLPGGCHEPAAP
uniref:Uncharacterized protein n=1 Tax=Strix occidentalis caurina TaxID=311401 RepID=A0A8D0EY60_STROC